MNPVQSALISLQAYPYHARAAAIMDILVGQERLGKQTSAADARGGLQSDAPISRLWSAATQPMVAATPG